MRHDTKIDVNVVGFRQHVAVTAPDDRVDLRATTSGEVELLLTPAVRDDAGTDLNLVADSARPCARASDRIFV
jgi:hypothetical protein